jgi:hypothetical protein
MLFYLLNCDNIDSELLQVDRKLVEKCLSCPTHSWIDQVLKKPMCVHIRPIRIRPVHIRPLQANYVCCRQAEEQAEVQKYKKLKSIVSSKKIGNKSIFSSFKMFTIEKAFYLHEATMSIHGKKASCGHLYDRPLVMGGYHVFLRVFFSFIHLNPGPALSGLRSLSFEFMLKRNGSHTRQRNYHKIVLCGIL